MWESLLLVAIIVFSWPLGKFACAFVCYGMGIANIPGFLLWKSDPGHKSVASSFGLIMGWLGQTLVSLGFCALLVALVRWIPSKLHIADPFIWLLWGTAFLTVLRPPFAVFRQKPQDEDEQSISGHVFASRTSIFTLCATAVSFVALAWLMRGTRPASPIADVDGLAERIVMYMVVEQDPDEYPPDVLEKIKAGLPALAKSYKECSPEQVDSLDRQMHIFIDYEDSQYDDVSRWYAQLADAVESKDAVLLARMKSANIISERTRAIADGLPGQIRKFAEDQMKGADAAPSTLWSAIPPGGYLTLSDVQAGQAAAKKFNIGRKQSYSNSYRQITGKDLISR
jgi:hypothetical protein